MIEIRHASPDEDSQHISDLINTCIKEKRTLLKPYTPEEEKQYHNKLQPREAVFVAYLKETFAGFSGVAPRWTYSEKLAHCGECGTWVMPDYRGMGVGRALWEMGIMPWCQDNRFTHLGAMVMSHNVGSLAFYLKMGFKVVGHHNKVVKWGDEYLDTEEIERILK